MAEAVGIVFGVQGKEKTADDGRIREDDGGLGGGGASFDVEMDGCHVYVLQDLGGVGSVFGDIGNAVFEGHELFFALLY